MIIVKNRLLLFSKNEQYLGTSYDKNSANREFKLDRINADGIDLSELIFKIDLKYADDTLDTDTVEISVISERDIHLTWTVPETVVSHSGAAWIQLRGIDDSGNTKWSSYKSLVYIEDYIGQATVPDDKVSELEKYEIAEAARINAENLRAEAETKRANAETERKKAEVTRAEAETTRSDAEAIRISNENTRIENEIARIEAEKLRAKAETEREETFDEKAVLAQSYAVGSTGIREGEDTDNSKYYSEQSNSYADKSNESKKAAAESASTAESLKYDAEAWAKGTRNGVEVGSDDETFHNNSKYYSDNAKETTKGGAMLEVIYDTEKKETDIFQYTDKTVSAEVTRATGAEQTNADAIAAETTRATGAEQANATNIATLQNAFDNLFEAVHTW